MKCDKLQKKTDNKKSPCCCLKSSKIKKPPTNISWVIPTKKKIQALPKKMGECHDINYVEFVYYVIMYLIINN